MENRANPAEELPFADFDKKQEKKILTVAVISGILIGVTILCGIVFLLRPRNKPSTSIVPTNNLLSTVIDPSLQPSPTPFLFQEMTIPFLRAREYTSQLGELVQVSDNSAYTAYTTSYDSDGLQVNGYLTIPKGLQPEGGWPAVVFVHGYIPPAQYRTTQNYISYVDFLAKNGLVVFKIDLRGHDQSEGEPGGGYYSADYVIDTLNARVALQNSDFVNAQKVGLWGHSMAGNVLLRSLAAQTDIPGIVIWAGAVYTYADMQEFGIDDTSYRPPAQQTPTVQRRQLLRETHGNFSADSEFWKQVAPTNYLTNIKGAIQIHHAVDDAVVSIDYSRNLMSLLDATAVRHELFEYSTGGHNLTGASFTQAMQRTADFFNSL